jgi:hypothetical protein
MMKKQRTMSKEEIVFTLSKFQWTTVRNTTKTNKRLILLSPPVGLARSFARAFLLEKTHVYIPSTRHDIFIGVEGEDHLFSPDYMLSADSVFETIDDILKTHYVDSQYTEFHERATKNFPMVDKKPTPDPEPEPEPEPTPEPVPGQRSRKKK